MALIGEEAARSALASFIEKNPHVGILASFAGFGASALTWLHAATILFGFVGASFGLVAGYYTMRVKYHQWVRENLRRI